jgi:sulfite reductase alpha subunit-like flavoprotein
VESGGEQVDVGPGSTLIIYPKNFPEDVQSLIDMMEWNEVADRSLQLAPYVGPNSASTPTLPPGDGRTKAHPKSASGIHANQGTTLRELLTHNLDITAVPKRTFLKELIYYASDELEKERLVELTQPGNTDDFYDYTFRPRRTILEVLSDFPSVKIPFERVLDCFPVIRGREFSIANGAGSHKETSDGDFAAVNVHVLAALVEYRTIIRKPRQGLCSRYLRSLQEGTLVKVKIKHNANTLLADTELDKRPLIAIATGTGIAPIKHLVEDRFDRTTAASRGDALLFFGCRNERADFYYRDYWESLEGLKVIPAFSRDPAPVLVPDDKGGPLDINGGQLPDYDYGKNYVQHQIRRHARHVAELIAKDALICVCGNSGRMPKSVREALLDAMVLGGLVERKEDAETVFQRLRFWQETW